MKKTILIIGITSFVGSNFAQVLSEKFRVVGTYHTSPAALPSQYPMLACNVLKKDEIKKAIDYFKPDYVLYAVGLSSLTKAKENPKEAEALNSIGVSNCLGLTERAGALFIYLSSAYVLSGDDKFFKEVDIPVPATKYGMTVANAEFLIQRSSLYYLILRCPVLYGLSYSAQKQNIFELLDRSVFSSKVIELDDTVVTGFLDVALVAKFVGILLEKNIVNHLLQLSSKDHATLYQFAKKYSEVFKVSHSNFEAKELPFPCEKKKEEALKFKMDVTNTEARIGMKMPTMEESLEFTRSRLSAKSS